MAEYRLAPGKIFQCAYVVPDLDNALDAFSRNLNIGGWLALGGRKPWPVNYLGNNVGLNISVALGFSGDTMYELIQQHDNAPSVYTGKSGVVEYGFHHWAVATDDVETAVRGYESRGYPKLMSIEGRQGLALYYDARPELPGMIELIKITPEFQAFASMIHDLRQDVGADGPVIRRL